MSVLYLLIPLALVLVIVFVAAYVWSSRTGQFDDLTTPALRVLLDDQPRSTVPTPPPTPEVPRT
jgi:cbb3-type cytochrome oxidase maturation protein